MHEVGETALRAINPALKASPIGVPAFLRDGHPDVEAEFARNAGYRQGEDAADEATDLTVRIAQLAEILVQVRGGPGFGVEAVPLEGQCHRHVHRQARLFLAATGAPPAICFGAHSGYPGPSFASAQ